MPCSKNARRRSRAPDLALVALLALAACDRPQENKANAPADGSAPPVVAADTPQPPVRGPSLAKPLRWAASSSGEGNAIVLFEGNAAVLRIACLRQTGLVVHGERLKPVGSEERMSIGAGDIIATLVATPATDRNPPTVKGEGELDQDFIRAVGEGRKIAVNYGYQNMGPYDGPPPGMARNFVAGCADGGG